MEEEEDEEVEELEEVPGPSTRVVPQYDVPVRLS